MAPISHTLIPIPAAFAPAYILGEMAGGALAGLLFRLRLRLQYLTHEHIAELKAKERDEA